MADQTEPERVNFVYALEGEIEHVDVFALAPTLLSLGKAVQDGTRTLHPLNSGVAVNVRPFRKGSFVVEVVVFGQTIDVQPFLVASALAAADIVKVLKAIGFLAGLGESALSTLRKLKGKKPEVTQLSPGEFRYTVEGDSNPITVSGNVHQLIQNPSVVNNISMVYATPLSDPRITGVRSFIEGEEQSTQVWITKDEAREIQVPTPVDRGADRTESNIAIILLTCRRVVLENDRRNWSFRRGNATITATIRDDAFLARVAAGQIVFRAGDLVRAELQETQHLTNGKLISTYEVLRVLEHITSPELPL